MYGFHTNNPLGDNMKMDFGRCTEKMNNYQLMIYATEKFMQLVYFLEQERGYKKLNLKIGTFQYDGWNAEIFCVFDESGITFKHTRDDLDNWEWGRKTLIEYAFAWDFEITEFKFNFDLISNFYNILNEEDQEEFDLLYDEVHCKLW